MSFRAYFLKLVLAALFCYSFPAQAERLPAASHEKALQLETMERQARNLIFANLQLTEQMGGRPGALIASPGERGGQNYARVWVRDEALVMRELIGFYENASSASEKEKYFKAFANFAEFSKHLQEVAAHLPAGLGEPLFLINGRPLEQMWGRPQNDGPALRAMTLSLFSLRLLKEGRQTEAQRLYQSIIRPDLLYVTQVYGQVSFDLWEEVLAHHFYTRMVQRGALREGARLAEILGDSQSASLFLHAERDLKEKIKAMLRDDLDYIPATLEFHGGHVPYKTSNLDIAVILGALHAHRMTDTKDLFFSASHPWILATAHRLIHEFSHLYPINQRGLPAVAIGRYPEDRYFDGNPWFLATLAIPELIARAYVEFQTRSLIKVDRRNQPFFNDLLIKNGGQARVAIGEVITTGSEKFATLGHAMLSEADQYIERVLFHKGEGPMSEQFSKHDGFQEALPDLSWSSAAFLRTQRAIKRARQCQVLLVAS